MGRVIDKRLEYLSRIGPAEVKRSQILEIGMYDPVVDEALSVWRRGSATWDQVMSWLVLVITRENTVLSDRLLRALKMVNEDQYKEIMGE